MYLIDHKCLICDSEQISTYTAAIATFVLGRMQGARNIVSARHPCTSIKCKKCEFLFSSIRFSLEEEKNYYFQYGEKDYLTHRAAVEGIGSVSGFHDYKSESFYKEKKSLIKEILKGHVNFDDVKSLLDFGGSDGSLIPEVFDSANKYLIDVSLNETVSNVIKVDSIDSCPCVDLIMCSHTLEHISDPKSITILLKEKLNPNGKIYVEVPFENSNPEGLLFHEHIQQFSLNTLTKLFEVCGLTVLDKGSTHYAGVPSIWILGSN